MSDEHTPPMARPRVAAGALIRNEAGEILLVKPTYKEGWEIPGGYVEPGESPKEACEREIREELGIDLTVTDLLVVDWAPAHGEGDKLLFIFSSDRAPRPREIVLPAAELSAAQYFSLPHVLASVPPRLARRLTSALAALNGSASYLEHGVAPTKA